MMSRAPATYFFLLQAYCIERWATTKDAGKDVHDGGIVFTLPFIRGETGAEVPFYESIIINFMVRQDRIETNLLQPVAQAE